MKRQHDLTQGAVWKVILTFAFPLLVGNLIQQVYNLTDSVIVGRFLGKEALAAVSASFFIYYFIISFVIGIGSGITVIVSQYFGARQYGKVQRAFSSFCGFTLIAGIFLSVSGIVFTEDFFRLTRTPEEVIPQAVRYFRIYAGGTVLFITFHSMSSVLRSMGDSARPMIFVLITAVLNILFDLLFIIGFGWEIEGAALATVAAQGIGVCIILAYIHRRHPLLSIRRKDWAFDGKLFMQGLRIGIPTSIQQVSIAIGLVALLGIVNRFGTDTLTAYGAAGKVDSFITQALLTVSSALAAFCGQNIGAGKLDRVKTGVRDAMWIMMGYFVLTVAVIYPFADEMMMLFVNGGEQEVIANAAQLMRISNWFYPALGVLVILRYSIQGLGYSNLSMMSGVMEMLARCGVSLWMVPAIAWLGVCYADPVAWLMADLFLIPAYFWLLRRLKEKVVSI